MATDSEPQALDHIREQYRDHWVLVDVTEQDSNHQPTAGMVMAHSQQRDELYEILDSTPAEDPLIFYTGKIPKHFIFKD